MFSRISVPAKRSIYERTFENVAARFITGWMPFTTSKNSVKEPKETDKQLDVLTLYK